MICIILAAGIGSRLKPLTDVTPKCLIPVKGKPILEYWLDGLNSLPSVDEVIVNTHYLHEKVSSYIDNIKYKYSFKITEFYEAALLGSAGTIYANRQKIVNQDVLIIYADNFSKINLSEFYSHFLNHKQKFNIAVFKAEIPQNCGIFEVDLHGNVISFEEKPKNPKSNLANSGIYFFETNEYLKKVDGTEFDIGFDILPKMVSIMNVFTIDGYHIDIGTYELLHKANTIEL